MVLSPMLQRVLTCEWIDGCKITDFSGLERMKVDKADVCVHCSLFSKRHSWPYLSLFSSQPVFLAILHHSCRCVASWWRLSVSRSFRLVLCTATLTQAMVSAWRREEGGKGSRGEGYIKLWLECITFILSMFVLFSVCAQGSWFHPCCRVSPAGSRAVHALTREVWRRHVQGGVHCVTSQYVSCRHRRAVCSVWKSAVLHDLEQLEESTKHLGINGKCSTPSLESLVRCALLQSCSRLQFLHTNTDWTVCGDAQEEVWSVSQAVPAHTGGCCPSETHCHRTHGQDGGDPQDSAQGSPASV